MAKINTKRLQQGKQDIRTALADLKGNEKINQLTKPTDARVQKMRTLYVPIDAITRHSDVQTRTMTLDPENSEEDARFVRSIKSHGVISPIRLRPLEDSEFQLVVGHRRLAACKYLGVEKIPAVIADCEEDAEELALQTVIENAHRRDLTDLEKAMLVQELSEQGLTQKRIAEEMNCSQGQISILSNLIKNTDSETLELVGEGKIGAFSASRIMEVPKAKRYAVIEAIRNNVSVNDAVQIVQKSEFEEEEQEDESETKTDKKESNKEKESDRNQIMGSHADKKSSKAQDPHLVRIVKNEEFYNQVSTYSKKNTVHKYALAAWVSIKDNFKDGLAAYNDTSFALTKRLNSVMLANAKLAIYLSLADFEIPVDKVIELTTSVYNDVDME